MCAVPGICFSASYEKPKTLTGTINKITYSGLGFKTSSGVSYVVDIINAGISGNTTIDGLARLEKNV